LGPWEIKPGDFVIPNQIIDRTKGIRPASFFGGEGASDAIGVVAHAGFGDPFSVRLTKWLEGRVAHALKDKGSNASLHTDKTVVCMEGPQFSTRAESLMYRAWGGDIINMSAIPESKLAREAEISYALIATATDYDAWRPHEASVTTADVFKTLQKNAETSRHVVASVLEDLFKAIKEDKHILGEEEGCMKLALVKQPETEEDRFKMSWILPEH